MGGKIDWRDWCTNLHSIWCAQGIKLYFGRHFCLFFCTQQTKDLSRNTLQTGQIRVICFAERGANELRHPLLLFEGQGTQGSTIVAMLSNNKTGSLSSLVPQNDISNPLWTCPSPTLAITSLFMQHKIHDNLQSSLSQFQTPFHEHSCFLTNPIGSKITPPKHSYLLWPFCNTNYKWSARFSKRKKEGRNKTHNIYLLSSTLESQNHSPKTDHSYLITTQKTQKNIAWLKHKTSVPLKRYYNSSKTTKRIQALIGYLERGFEKELLLCWMYERSQRNGLCLKLGPNSCWWEQEQELAAKK